MSEIFMDVLQDCVIDTLKVVPFLFVTYLLMEYLEHRTSDRTLAVIRRADRMGPFFGGILGVIPQCGFSAAAAGFFAGRVITAGTLLAVFLSTSDEMLPILISGRAGAGTIGRILFLKALFGVMAGFLTDFLFRRFNARKIGSSIHDLCEHDNCNCETDSILVSAIRHTLQIVLFLFIVSLLLNLVIEGAGEDALRTMILNRPFAGELLAGIVGLIPNCAASVVITTLYLEGAMSGGAMMSGLLVGAGIGILVLFRMNRNVKESLQLTALLYVFGVAGGLLTEFLHLL